MQAARTTLQALGMALMLIWVGGLTGCRTKSFLSTGQEINLGREGASQIEQEYRGRVETDTARARRVRRIAGTLLPHMADRREVPYSVKVIETKDVNAVSLPGGPLYVYSGLLDLLGDDDAALAGVLGHELGHINARHAARQISSQMATGTLLDLALPNGGGGRAGAQLLSTVLSLRYSRDDEYDADRRGISYAAASGYDPRGIVRFFEALTRLERGGGGGGGPEFLRTHPLTTTRIERANALIESGNFKFGR